MIYFIVNQTSGTGKGKIIWEKVRELADASGKAYEAYVTEYEGHARELAAQICEKEDPDICLVIVGGDGTMNEVLDGMRNYEKVRVGIIPTGSGNDFCRGLGVSTDMEAAWQSILQVMEQGNEAAKSIDLGQVNWEGCKAPRLFGISAGVGLDAIVCKKALHSNLKRFLNKIHLGKLTYILLTVQTLFSMKTADGEVEYRNERGEVFERKALKKMIFSAAMNLRAEGGGVPMAPRANCYDGKLSMCSAFGIPKWRTFFCLPLLTAARHERLKGFQIIDAREIHMTLSKPMTLHADGEYMGEVAEITFTTLPRKLRMLME